MRFVCGFVSAQRGYGEVVGDGACDLACAVFLDADLVDEAEHDGAELVGDGEGELCLHGFGEGDDLCFGERGSFCDLEFFQPMDLCVYFGALVFEVGESFKQGL